MPVDDCGWAFVKDERQRYFRARRWRSSHALPERMFLRVPVEDKPVAADFRSLVLVNLFAKLMRQTKAAGFAQFTVSEMLPDLGQLWLRDNAGRSYSSELRMVAYDSMTEDQAPQSGRNHEYSRQGGRNNASVHSLTRRNRGGARPEARVLSSGLADSDGRQERPCPRLALATGPTCNCL